MVIKQFQNFTANKVFNQYKALVRALESRLVQNPTNDNNNILWNSQILGKPYSYKLPWIL